MTANFSSAETPIAPHNVESDPIADRPGFTEKISRLKHAATFSLARYAANIELAGAIVAGNAVHAQYGTSRWLLSMLTAATVLPLEYVQARYNAKAESQSESNDPTSPLYLIYDFDVGSREPYRRVAADLTYLDLDHPTEIFANWPTIKEPAKKGPLQKLKHFAKGAGALVCASWQGAGGNVTLNNALDLENTKARSLVQSGAYASGVGLWVSPIPPFSTLRNHAVEEAHNAIENPIEYSAYGLLASLALYAVLSGAKRILDRKDSGPEAHTWNHAWGLANMVEQLNPATPTISNPWDTPTIVPAQNREPQLAASQCPPFFMI